jgi:hypothetical protein
MSTSATYTVTEQDTVEALRLHWRTTRPILFLQVVIGFWVIALVFIGPTEIIRFLAIACVVMFILIRLILGPLIQRRTYRKYKLLQEPVTLNFDDDGVKLSTDSYYINLKWDKFIRWKDDDNYILLYISPRQYYVIPKRIMDDGFKLEVFIERIYKVV